ncbi:MAG: hypothetical protein N2572_03450 [Syntrophales bacterium]|nr:hypothetical protein [Syntrophales bacterium]
MKLSTKEISLIKLLQDDFPLEKRPFLLLGKACQMEEEQVLEILYRWKKEGLMRKFGAALRHHRVGYNKNALVVWAVPSPLIDQVGKALAQKKWVSHCYERKPPYLNRYNLFTMVHFPLKKKENIIEEMVKASGISDYIILETIEELKKTSMRYF